MQIMLTFKNNVVYNAINGCGGTPMFCNSCAECLPLFLRLRRGDNNCSLVLSSLLPIVIC